MSDKAVHQANAVVHFDISGADDSALRRFYGDLLNWHVEPKGPGYAVVHTPGGLAGSIVGDPQPAVTLGIAVENLEQAVGRATELGGTVLMPPTDNGWVTKAQIKDPAGNVLTLIQA
jgi:predicted enzyme related to lactoylglutathione lyase